MCHQNGELEEAVKLYLQVLPLQRNNHELLFTIGTVFCQLGRLEDGLCYLRKAARSNPKNFHVFGNIGTVLAELHRFDESIINYNKAITLNPSFIEALFGRANAFLELNKLTEALVDYEQCLTLEPNFAIAHCNKSKVQIELNQLDSAVLSCDRAIELEPRLIEAYCNRAKALKKLGQNQRAIDSYSAAIEINKDIHGAYLDLAKAFYEIGRQSEGDSVLKRVLILNQGFYEAAWVKALSKIPLIPQSVDEIKVARIAFKQSLTELAIESNGVSHNDAYKAVGAAQPFYLAFHEFDNKEVLSKYGTLCVQLMKRVFPGEANSFKNKSRNNRLRVGIVSNHIHRHSVWDALIRGWVTSIDRELFDIIFFYTGNLVDGETTYAKSIATGFFQCGNDLTAWINKIRDEGVDVLLFPEIGMDPMTLKLASLRLAPVQVASWGHPETTGLPTIDYYLSAELIEPQRSEIFYTEHLVKLPNLGTVNERADVPQTSIDLMDFGLDANLPLLICAGTPFKYQPQFDKVLVEIATKLYPCQLVFFTFSTNELSNLLKARIELEFFKQGIDCKKILHFVPWQSKATFYALLRKADVYLDTIGFSGFNSALQALECGLPVVTREGEFMRGRLASGLLKRIGLNQLISENEQGYVNLVEKLVRDQEFNRDIRKLIQNRLHLVFDDLEPIRSLEKFFTEAYERTAKTNLPER